MIDNLNATLEREANLTNERRQTIAETAIRAGRDSDLLDSVRDAMDEAGLDISAAYGESCDITVHVTYRFRNVRRRDGADPWDEDYARQSLAGLEETIRLDEDWVDSDGEEMPYSDSMDYTVEVESP